MNGRYSPSQFKSVLGEDFVDCGEAFTLARTHKAIRVHLIHYKVNEPIWVPRSAVNPECEVATTGTGILELRLWLAKKLNLYIGNYVNVEYLRDKPSNQLPLPLGERQWI